MLPVGKNILETNRDEEDGCFYKIRYLLSHGVYLFYIIL